MSRSPSSLWRKDKASERRSQERRAGELRRAEEQVESLPCGTGPRALAGARGVGNRVLGSSKVKGQTGKSTEPGGLEKPGEMGKLIRGLVSTREQGQGQPYHQAVYEW